MKKTKFTRLFAVALAFLLVVSVAAATFKYDLNGDGKTNVWDLQLALSQGKTAEEQAEAVREALGGGDELHKNAAGQWEIWTITGLYNMAAKAEAGETFVLMQDVDMGGITWTPVRNFNGTLIGNDHKIFNMKITQAVDGNMGFFASIAAGGTVRRVNLADMNMIAAQDSVSIGLVAGTCAGKLDACTAIGFVTDNRTALPADMKIGGLVGTLTSTGEVVTHVENMLPTEGQGSEIPNISAKFAARTAPEIAEAYAELVAIVGDVDGTVDPMALLENLTGTMPDPNAIAWVQHGDVTTYPITVKEMLAMVNADGNSVITLKTDIVHNAVIKLPYSCTFDLGGYSVRRNPSSGNCIEVAAAGSENKVTTLCNGTVYHQEMGIRVEYGAVVVSNVKMYGINAPCVGIYDPSPDYNDIHKIVDSELYNRTWGVFAYNRAESDFSNVNITIERSKLASTISTGSALLVKRSGSTGGNVTLGFDVEMYTYGTSLSSGNTVLGVDPVKLDGTADLTVDGIHYAGLNHWTTNESVIATEVIADVTNGDKTIQVTNTRDLSAAISSDGNTQIKLLKDITSNIALNIPYSCTLDLNGFSITNTASNLIVINGVGSKNTVTKIKNGTLNHGAYGICVNTGSIDLSGVTINGVGKSGASIAFYDADTAGAYRANNKIDNCQIYNPNSYCLRYDKSNVDFSNTGILLTNSTLIASNAYLFSVPTSKFSGVVELGENLNLYSNKSVLATNMFRFSGRIANLSNQNSVTVGGTTVSGVKHWSTNIEHETINVLLLGNSLSTTIPEELYQIAKADGMSVTVTDLYHAGAYGWQHKDWIINNADEYEYRVYNDMGFWMHGDIKSVPAAVDYMEWDHVSYQEWINGSYGKTYDKAISSYDQYVEWIFDYLKAEIPNAQFYFYEHWSWQVGHSSVPDVATQTALFEVIRDASHYFAEKNDAILIPCGEAWQLARADSLIGDTMCKDDNLHDNGATGGQYLNGCVFFEVMFQKTCIGDTWRASGGNSPSEAVHQALQKHAHNAVAAVHGENYAK